MRNIISVIAFALGAMSPISSPSHATTHTTASERGHAATLSDGEVRKVDKEAKKLTIRHGPLANLDMPAMTMVFQVKDVALLETVKAGDKVKFAADKDGGAYVVTQIEVSK